MQPRATNDMNALCYEIFELIERLNKAADRMEDAVNRFEKKRC